MADGSQITRPAAPGRGRLSAPDDVWSAARADYLAGLTGPDVCRRHGVGIRALRERAAREGWRRADQPWIPSNRLDPLDEGVALEDRIGGDLDRLEYRELVFVAERRMMRSVLRGDAGAALRWSRVRDLMEAGEAEIQRLMAQDDAIAFDRAGHAELAAMGAEDAG